MQQTVMQREQKVTTALADALSTPVSECVGTPIDPVDLAEYLDGVLPGPQRAEIEAHLAACTSCRTWAMEAGLAIAPEEIRRPRRKWQPLVAAATVIFAILVGLFWQQTQKSRLLTRLATAEIPQASLFDSTLFGTASSPTLRAGNSSNVPHPVEPRWSALREPRPTLHWYAGNAGPVDGEILVVDDQDRLVASFSTDGAIQQPNGRRELPWPNGLDALTVDSTYAWKINEIVDGEWRASEFVPFQRIRVHDPDFPEDPLARAISLADLGLFNEALISLAKIHVQDNADVERLARQVLQQKRLQDDVLEKELERWRDSR